MSGAVDTVQGGLGIPDWVRMLLTLLLGFALRLIFNKSFNTKKQYVSCAVQTVPFAPRIVVTPHGDCYHDINCEIVTRNPRSDVRRPCR
jgi:hypothetical protein